MNHRERILAAARRQPVDRLATDIWATPEVWQKLSRHFGIEGDAPRDRLALYEALGIDGIFKIIPPYIGPQRPVETRADGTTIRYDAWGMGYRMQAYGGGAGAYEEQVVFPLAEARSLADLEAFPWPSPDWYDYAALPALAAQYPGRAIECGYTGIFYWHNRLRGLENSMADGLLEPEMTSHLLDRVSDFFTAYHARCFEALRGIVDVTQVTDDFGSQYGLLISPKTFDTFYRVPIQRAIDLARSCSILVFHHDDGDCRPLLPRLVQMGIEILNPIQWRCGNWDLDALKSEYGERLCFHGGVDNQQTLPVGTPEDVRAEVRWQARTLGRDRTGYICAPCHRLQQVSPVENILAMYDEISKC